MPARRRPARAIAIAATAEEGRRRLVAISIHCTLAASLILALALAAF